MSMIDRLKSPQAAIGLFVAGLLLFAVIGIARELSGSTVAAAAQSNVGRAVRAVDHIDIAPVTIPAVGAVQVDAKGDKWIWSGRLWLACIRIDPVTLAYDSIKVDPAITDWHRLTTGDKHKVVEVCK